MIDLQAVWLTQVEDPSIGRPFDDVAPYQWGREPSVRPEATAAGTIRMIRTARRGPRATQLQLRGISRDDTDWLVEHAEELFCYRDHTSRILFGWWEPPTVGELEWVDGFTTVTLVFHEATASEAV